MKKAKFTVYGEPKGKGRPRFNTKTGHAITPKDTVSYENLVKLEWQEGGDPTISHPWVKWYLPRIGRNVLTLTIYH